MFNFVRQNFNISMPFQSDVQKELRRCFTAYPNLKPLSKDTVSFSGKNSKNVTDKSYYQGSGNTIHKLLADADICKESYDQALKEIFGQYCDYDNHMAKKYLGKLTFSKKSEASLRDKFASKQIASEDEAKDEIRDIIRARIVLNDTSDQKSADVICNALIKQNKLKIVTIKNYYEMDSNYNNGFDTQYIPFKSLLKLDKVNSDKYNLSSLQSGTTKDNGYNAVHIIFQLDNGFYAELQIMGDMIEQAKEVEDILYKIKSDKPVDKKYSEVQEAYRKFVKDKPAREKELLEYTRKVYNAERMKELGKYRGSEQTRFLPLPKNSKLPEIFDFNNLYKIDPSIIREKRKA